MDAIDTKRRVLFLNAGIDEDALSLVHSALQEFGGRNCRIVINSGGGDVVTGLGIIDLIRAYPGKITMDVVGAAESMAAVILQAAPVRRMHASSFLMIHQGVDEPEADTKRNIRSYLKMGDRNDDLCDELVLSRIRKKHPKYSWAKFRSETENDQYFTPEQALKWGLIDSIIKPKRRAL